MPHYIMNILRLKSNHVRNCKQWQFLNKYIPIQIIFYQTSDKIISVMLKQPWHYSILRLNGSVLYILYGLQTEEWTRDIKESAECHF